MAMLVHQCISLTRTRMTSAEEVDLKRHFLQTPDSIVLTGKDAKRRFGKTFGNINQSATDRKCLRAGLYCGSPTDTRGYDDQPATLQNELLSILVKRAAGVLASNEITACVSAGKNMCVLISPHISTCLLAIGNHDLCFPCARVPLLGVQIVVTPR